jgi:hypothetical protein
MTAHTHILKSPTIEENDGHLHIANDFGMHPHKPSLCDDG